MKSNNLLTASLALMLLAVLPSCKKYGTAFKDGYNDASGNEQGTITVDTAMSRVDRSMYAKARVFPGLVDAAEPRLINEKVKLDLNFSSSTAQTLRISVAPSPQFSTGYYAPAGELIKIVVPAGISGLSVQVGGHTDNLTGHDPLLRDPIIYTVKQLFPGVNYVRNLYGGTIYIRAQVAIAQPVELIFTGAVKAPDFVLGEITDAEWNKKVQESSVPWLEMRSKRVIFLIPRSFLLRMPVANPTALMTEWNAKFELDYNGWMGLSDNSADIRDRSPQSAWRGILDIQLSVGYGHSGFPFVGTMDDEWFGGMTNLQSLLNGSNWGTYHEFGHNCQQGLWSWSTLGETTNNLFSFKIANRNKVGYAGLHPAMPNANTEALAFAASKTAKNFDTYSVFGPFHRIIPFLQIFDLYGYDAMAYLYTEARHAARTPLTDIEKHDFVYEKFSDYAKTDLKLFFEAWGIDLTPQMKSKVAALYPRLTKTIWTYNPMTKTGGTGAVIIEPTVTASSEERVGEGTNGFAKNLIDNNNNTFWHSQWQGSPLGAMPYTLTYDFGEPTLAKGMYFVPRDNASQRPKDIDIFTSTDNVNWTKEGSTVMTNAFSRFNYNFPAAKTARYYRLVIKNNHSGTSFAALAELGLIR
ncbi:M60 family metallopeptidase [Pedobacter gandavensis]|nr:M60 family metallopeptidase [Pedobacter gandavensis]